MHVDSDVDSHTRKFGMRKRENLVSVNNIEPTNFSSPTKAHVFSVLWPLTLLSCKVYSQEYNRESAPAMPLLLPELRMNSSIAVSLCTTFVCFPANVPVAFSSLQIVFSHGDSSALISHQVNISPLP